MVDIPGTGTTKRKGSGSGKIIAAAAIIGVGAYLLTRPKAAAGVSTTGVLKVNEDLKRVGINNQNPTKTLDVTGKGQFSDQLVVKGGSDVSLASGSGYLILGDPAKQHVTFDNNETQSKSDGTTPSTWILQNEGGSISIGGSKSDNLTLSTKAASTTNTLSNSTGLKLISKYWGGTPVQSNNRTFTMRQIAENTTGETRLAMYQQSIDGLTTPEICYINESGLHAATGKAIFLAQRQSSLAANVAMTTAGTWYDGPAFGTGNILEAGIWYISGTVTVYGPANTAFKATAKLWNGTAVESSSEGSAGVVSTTEGGVVSITLSGIITANGTDTYKISAVSTDANCQIVTSTPNYPTGGATRIVAFRIG